MADYELTSVGTHKHSSNLSASWRLGRTIANLSGLFSVSLSKFGSRLGCPQNVVVGGMSMKRSVPYLMLFSLSALIVSNQSAANAKKLCRNVTMVCTFSSESFCKRGSKNRSKEVAYAPRNNLRNLCPIGSKRKYETRMIGEQVRARHFNREVWQSKWHVCVICESE